MCSSQRLVRFMILVFMRRSATQHTDCWRSPYKYVLIEAASAQPCCACFVLLLGNEKFVIEGMLCMFCVFIRKREICYRRIFLALSCRFLFQFLTHTTTTTTTTIFFFFFFFILRRMGKNKALAHHTSTYFHTRRVSI